MDQDAVHVDVRLAPTMILFVKAKQITSSDLDLGVNDSAVVTSTERLEEFKKSVVLKTGHQMYSAFIFHHRMSY